MSRLHVALGFALTMGAASVVDAGTVTLQSILTNANGATDTTLAGYSTASFDTTTGIGTLTYVFNPGAPGSYFFDVFFDQEIADPFYNEFGTALGAPAAGQSWEIGDSFASNIYNDVLAGGSLPNTNSLPGQQSNFFNDCVGASCNGDFASALGFAFTLGPGEIELITLNVSLTDPGGSGLRLEGIHPVDAGNDVETDIFIAGTAVSCSEAAGCQRTAPEPSTLALLGSGVAIVLTARRRRLSVNL